VHGLAGDHVSFRLFVVTSTLAISCLLRGARAATSLGDDGGSCLASCVRCCIGKVFGFNHKIMINIQESSPSIMVTRNL
jgi:hypothetical protein